jgi:hypothetical protein
MTSELGVKRVRVRRRRHLRARSLFSSVRFLLLPLAAGFLLLSFLNADTEAWVAFNSGLPPDRLTVEPTPTDCGLSPCHYEPVFHPVKDKNGGHFVVTWQRVDE